MELQPIAAFGPALAVAGCDPALALLAGPLARHRTPTSLVWWSCNNTTARGLLGSNTVHAAAVHRGVGEVLTRPAGHEVVGFAAWREGLVVSAEHAGSVRSLAHALELGLRLANREPGIRGAKAPRCRAERSWGKAGAGGRIRQRLQRSSPRRLLDRGRPGGRRRRERARRPRVWTRFRALAGGDLRAPYPQCPPRNGGGPGAARRPRRPGSFRLS